MNKGVNNQETESEDLTVKDLLTGGVAKSKNVGSKISDKVEKVSAKLIEKQKIKSKSDYSEIKDEVSVDTTANNWYMFFAPVIGFIMQPAILLLVLDINDEQLRIIKATLAASAIGLILTVLLVMIAFKDGINKTVMSVYRHFYTKKEISDLELSHIIENTNKLETENKELKAEVEKLNKDLFEYNVDKELKKRASQGVVK